MIYFSSPERKWLRRKPRTMEPQNWSLSSVSSRSRETEVFIKKWSIWGLRCSSDYSRGENLKDSGGTKSPDWESRVLFVFHLRWGPFLGKGTFPLERPPWKGTCFDPAESFLFPLGFWDLHSRLSLMVRLFPCMRISLEFYSEMQFLGPYPQKFLTGPVVTVM